MALSLCTQSRQSENHLVYNNFNRVSLLKTAKKTSWQKESYVAGGAGEGNRICYHSLYKCFHILLYFKHTGAEMSSRISDTCSTDFPSVGITKDRHVTWRHKGRREAGGLYLWGVLGLFLIRRELRYKKKGDSSYSK